MISNVKSWAFVGVVSTLLGGCSGSVDGGGTSSSGMSSSSGMGGAGGVGGMGSGGSAGAGGGGIACGGFAGVQCAATEWCDYSNDICGAADGQGVCRPRPEACDQVYAPVCACDGMVYSNDCTAQSMGVDVSNLMGCMPPMPGWFGCGHGFCDSATDYCQKTNSDVPGLPDSFTCAPLPAACGGMPPSCVCIGDPCGAPIPGMCAASGDGFMVTCPGG